MKRITDLRQLRPENVVLLVGKSLDDASLTSGRPAYVAKVTALGHPLYPNGEVAVTIDIFGGVAMSNQAANAGDARNVMFDVWHPVGEAFGVWLVQLRSGDGAEIEESYTLGHYWQPKSTWCRQFKHKPKINVPTSLTDWADESFKEDEAAKATWRPPKPNAGKCELIAWIREEKRLNRVNQDAPQFHLMVDVGKYNATVFAGDNLEQFNVAVDIAKTILGLVANLPEPGKPAHTFGSVRLDALYAMGRHFIDSGIHWEVRVFDVNRVYLEPPLDSPSLAAVIEVLKKGISGS